MNSDHDRYRKKHILIHIAQADIHLVDTGLMLLPSLIFPVQSHIGGQKGPESGESAAQERESTAVICGQGI